MTRAVLFDLGDTLFRLLPMADVTGAFASLLANEGFSEPEDEAARILGTLRERLAAGYGRGQLIEPSIAEQVRPFIGADARAEALASALDHLLGESDIARWEAAEEREFVFDALRSNGLKVGYVSNTLTSSAQMRRRLDELGLLGHAEVAVFSVEHGVRKPNPKIYEAALKAISLEPAEVIFVGDRVREDVRGPQSLGMRAVLTHEFRHEEPADSAPLAVISHLRDVLSLL